MSLYTFGRIPKLTTFSFEDSQLSIFKHTLKTHCTSNNWPILAQKVPKEAWRCGLQAFKLLSQKYFVVHEQLVSKFRSVYTYAMTQTVYFGWICNVIDLPHDLYICTGPVFGLTNQLFLLLNIFEMANTVIIFQSTKMNFSLWMACRIIDFKLNFFLPNLATRAPLPFTA